jgi:hypothetical protein
LGNDVRDFFDFDDESKWLQLFLERPFKLVNIAKTWWK